MNVIAAKIAICLLCFAFLGLALFQKKRIAALAENVSAPVWVGLLCFFFRLIPFSIVFLALGIHPTSDVNGFWQMATQAAEGKLVYRDFWSPYSPFYSYLLAMGAWLWPNPRVVVLTMIILEAVAVLASLSYFKKIIPRSELFFRALLYFLLPGSLILCVIGAQEDIWIWMFFVLALLVRRKTGSTVAYALILALGILTTKVIFVLFLVPLFLIEKNKIGFLWPLALVGAASLAILYATTGTEFLQPIGEADTLRAPNLVSVLNPWMFNHLGMGKGFWNWIGLLATVLSGCIVALNRRSEPFEVHAARIFITLYATLMIVQQSAYSNYLFIFLLPLTLAFLDFGNRKVVLLFFLYNVVCTIHPSYWWRAGMPKYYQPADVFSGSTALIDYSLQLTIIILTLYFIRVKRFEG